MDLGFFDFLLCAVVLGVSLEGWRLYLRHLQKGGQPLFDKTDWTGLGGGDGGDGSSAAAADLQQELADLRERVQVLEAIVTDRGADLSRQIADLERRA